MSRRHHQRRRAGRRNYVAEKNTSTKMQLVMACGLLAMLLALGPTLSDGAAGCFQAVSGDVDETASRVVKRAPPTTRVQINSTSEPSDATSPDVGVNEDDLGGEVSPSIPSADSARP